MLFNSLEFIFLFLPTTLLVFFSIGGQGHHRIACAWLVAVSLFYYGWWKPAYLGLIIASILFNFALGIALANRHKTYQGKLILTLGIFCNLAPLGYYKYTNFFIANLNEIANTRYHLEQIILPLGISFFTFQQITYLVDTYRGEAREYNFLHYCLYVSFFPQLVAGPIVHRREVLPQFAQESIYRFNATNLSDGLSIFLIGLFKKVVFADGIAVFATPVFQAADQGTAITFFEAWAGALSYAFQLYFDFSGYSDMAIGLGWIFGIRLPLNFYSPYKAVNIIEFWRRWHITLSRFLCDYLYIPLGGNRKGSVRRYVNLCITMVLGGLWHGAGWTYVAWGALHGFYLAVNNAWRSLRKLLGHDLDHSGRTERALAITITFLSVVVAWVIFRAETFAGAANILKGMACLLGFMLPDQIAGMIPGLNNIVETAGRMPLLGGGTVMGVFEMSALLLLMTFVLFLPATQDMSARLRSLAIVASSYFTIQAVMFTRVPSEFLYFQF